MRRKPNPSSANEPIEAHSWDGVEWTGEVDADGVEIGLVDASWTIPEDLEVIENVSDHEASFETDGATDAGVWDDEDESLAAEGAGWTADPTSEESTRDAFKALVEGNELRPPPQPSPPARKAIWLSVPVFLAVGAVVLVGLLIALSVAVGGAWFASGTEETFEPEQPALPAPAPTPPPAPSPEELSEEGEADTDAGEEDAEEEPSEEDLEPPAPRPRRSPVPAAPEPEPEPEP